MINHPDWTSQLKEFPEFDRIYQELSDWFMHKTKEGLPIEATIALLLVGRMAAECMHRSGLNASILKQLFLSIDQLVMDVENEVQSTPHHR